MPGPLFMPPPRRARGPGALVPNFIDLFSSTNTAGSFTFSSVGPVGPYLVGWVWLQQFGAVDPILSLDTGGGAVAMTPLTSVLTTFYGEGTITLRWFLIEVSAENADVILSLAAGNSFGAGLALWNVAGNRLPTLLDDLAAVATSGSFSLDHAEGGAIFAAGHGVRATSAYTTLGATGITKDDGPVANAGQMRFGCGSLATAVAAEAQAGSLNWSGGSGTAQIRTHAISLSP